MPTSFEVRKKDTRTGGVENMITRVAKDDAGKVTEEEEWGTIEEMDRLFDTCKQRWGTNWDLNKLLIAVRESPLD